MFEPVWRAVVSGTYCKEAAYLLGYQRRKIRGELYPALVPGKTTDRVDGVIYLDVDRRDAARLDRFEGEYYTKRKEICTLSDGGRMSASTYVFREEFFDFVAAESWDPAWFEQKGMADFMASYRGYRWIEKAPESSGSSTVG
jgi:gamma-glutamylcyclotransferase (GGCT)/AIG2-like uncharacterized protein YtfP